MKTRRFILRETALLAIGEAVCIAAMYGIFVMLNAFDYTVIVGSIFGVILAIGNFFFMAIISDTAADKAMDSDIKLGKKIMKASYRMRLVIIGVLLFVLAKSGHCNIFSLVCPLFFVFPIVCVIEFFRKSGDTKS